MPDVSKKPEVGDVKDLPPDDTDNDVDEIRAPWWLVVLTDLATITALGLVLFLAVNPWSVPTLFLAVFGALCGLLGPMLRQVVTETDQFGRPLRSRLRDG